MTEHREQVHATLNKAATQIKNGKDSKQAVEDFKREARQAGGVLGEFADRLERGS